MPKVFWNGRSQAVRLPQECRFDEDQELVIRKVGRAVVIEPADDFWSRLREALATSTPDLRTPARPGRGSTRESIQRWVRDEHRKAARGGAAEVPGRAPATRPRRRRASR